MFTYIELFSGPGGLTTGFKRAGLHPLISVEFSETTVKTYSANHNVQVITTKELLSHLGFLDKILEETYESILIWGDVRDVSNEMILELLEKKYNLKTVDLVAGCPPCESYSFAGQRLEKDDRNDLFIEIVRIAHGLNSKLLFFENVKGLLTKKKNGIKGGQFEHIVECIESTNEINGTKFRLANKEKDVVILLATEYGVPQKRERIFLIGINESYPEAIFNYPEKTHIKESSKFITVEEAFYDLPIIHNGEGNDEYEIVYSFKGSSNISNKHLEYLKEICGDNNTGLISSHKASKHREYMVERFKCIRQGEGMRAASNRLHNEGKKDIVNRFFPKKIYEARGRRLVSNEPSFTVTSHCFDEMLHPIYDRALTVREVARLQTFPDSYKFEGPYVAFHSSPIQDRYEQIGDAVPVILAEKLGHELVNTLRKMKVNN